MFEPLFMLQGKFYEQCDGVATVPISKRLYMSFCHFENIWLENWSLHFKTIRHRRFIDDSFDRRITLKNIEIMSINCIKT